MSADPTPLQERIERELEEMFDGGGFSARDMARDLAPIIAAEIRKAQADALREAAGDIAWSAETLPDMTPHDAARGLARRAADIEKETETPDYWRECAKGLHATVVKLQDAEEVLRARAERAESERDEAEARECKDLDVHWRYVVVLDDLAQAQKERDEADRRTSEAEEQRDQWKKHHDRVDGQWAKAEREVTKLRAAQEPTDAEVEAACAGFYNDASGLTSWDRLVSADPALAEKYRVGIRAALAGAKEARA